MSDVERLGIDKAAEIELEIAWKDAYAIYMSAPDWMAGTGRSLAARGVGVGRVAKEGLCGMEMKGSHAPSNGPERQN
jgi:hypothetical protein